MINSQKRKQRIIILGSGFAGLRCAINLGHRIKGRSDVELILVDKRPYQNIYPSFYQIIAEVAKKDAVCIPIAETIADLPIQFIQDWVEDIDPVNQRVKLHQNDTLHYDYLVLGLGAVMNDYHIPGLADYATRFNNFEDLVVLRRELKEKLKKHDKVTIAVGGGGPTGVEVSLAFRYLAKKLGRRDKNKQIEVILIEQAEHVLGQFNPQFITATEEILAKAGVTLKLGATIKKITNNSVELETGVKVTSDLFIWTGGVMVNPLIGQAGFELDAKGRVLVNKYLQVKGYSKTYAVGDVAGFWVNKDETLPQIVPYAIRQGRLVADNIARQLHDQHPAPFHPGNAINLIPLAGYTGLFRFNSHVFQGRWVLWLNQWLNFYYLSGILPLSTAWMIAMDGRHRRVLRSAVS